MERFMKAAAAAAVTLCLALTLGAAPAHAETQGAASVTASALNLRSEASASSPIVACLPRGATVLVTGSSGGWYQVSYNGQTGYMSADYLSFSASADVDLGTGVVTGSGVRVRSGPGTSYGVLATVNSGVSMAVTGVSGAWYKVSYNGQTGYISSTYLRLGGGSVSTGSTASGTGVVSGSDVRMRSGPGTSYSVLGAYGPGTQMTVTGTSGDWYQVSYNGRTGYIYKSYLTLGGGGGAPAPSSYTVTAMDSAEAAVTSPVNMRSGPGTSYGSDRVLGAGTAVTVTGQSGNWYRVSYNGAEGYIFRTYLSMRSAQTPAPAASTEGQRLVDTAKKYLGVPYVYGGTSPSGFDCSGLVYYVYRECGYSITRTATAQNSVGSYVSRDALQPGDIVIFYNSAMSAIGHAGIYVGDGQFIHASSGAGKVVISSLSASYYNTHYYSARRVV